MYMNAFKFSCIFLFHHLTLGMYDSGNDTCAADIMESFDALSALSFWGTKLLEDLLNCPDAWNVRVNLKMIDISCDNVQIKDKSLIVKIWLFSQPKKFFLETFAMSHQIF